MILPVVLNIAPHEKRQAAKLVQYIKELDGTDVITMSFNDPPGMLYPEVANWAFKQCAKAMRGKPWFWLEADSIPLKPGWLKAISDKYWKIGKPYLYAKTFNPPFDNFTGIGVQSPEAYDHAPDGFTTGGFDEWIATKYADQMGRTDLICHNYGSYDANGDVTLHEFPRDMHIIGDGAVIFHKDQKQGLIDHLMPSLKGEDVLNVSGCGDIGDLVVSLASLNHRGGKFDYYLRDNGQTAGIVRREHIVAPLVEAQPYINAVRIWKREPIAWASEGFRPRWHNCIDSLAMCHAKHAFDSGFLSSLPDLSKPWLVAEPDKNFGGNIIINRSDRYQNNYFQWASIVKHYGERLLFIGMPDEHQRFVAKFGNVRYLITKDMLEVAKAITGSALFIGNQSSCMTIAEGLKHPRIQETCLHIPDCIYPPSNAQYVATGEVVLPDVEGSGAISLRPPTPIPEGIETPPGGWQYPGIPINIQHPNVAVNILRQQKPELTPAQAREAIMIHNAERIPAFFSRGMLDKDTSKFRLAMQNAGHK